MLRAQRGVTLMELMVVVVVVGILAAIAYPSYREQVRRSNRTDAKVALEQTAAALEKCFTRYMRYDDFANCPAANQFQAGGSLDTEHGFYRITATIPRDVALPTNSYRLTATPLAGQAADAQCGNFMLDERGNKTVSGVGTNCW